MILAVTYLFDILHCHPGMHAWFAAAADKRYSVVVPIIGVQVKSTSFLIVNVFHFLNLLLGIKPKNFSINIEQLCPGVPMGHRQRYVAG